MAKQGPRTGTPVPPQNDRSEGLTCIHARIHCVATPDTGEEHSEADLIIINNFLNTLAEIALAVASREAGQHTDD
jgi:hypothetical protein